MNIIILLIEIILFSVSLLIVYKKYKYNGIYIWILLSLILSSIMVQKTVEIFDLELNLGFVLNTLVFTASNIIIQKKGPKEINKVIGIVIFSNICVYTLAILSTLITNSNINELTNKAYNNIFYLTNRAYFGNIISLCITLWINSVLYHQIRLIKNKIWISNVLSTIITHFIESTMFCIIAFSFKLSPLNVIELITIRYIFKLIIGLISTSTLYATNSLNN